MRAFRFPTKEAAEAAARELPEVPHDGFIGRHARMVVGDGWPSQLAVRVSERELRVRDRDADRLRGRGATERDWTPPEQLEEPGRGRE